MRTIVFIHGFGGRAAEFLPLERHLRAKGHTKFATFSYKEKYGRKNIPELARELAQFLQNIPGKVDIVAHSMGGIIAEYYLLTHNDKVRTIITICTPYNGSMLGCLLTLPACRDLRPGSNVLNEIKNNMRRENRYAVYTPFDLTIIPFWSAIPAHGRTKRVHAPMHALTLRMHGTKQFVEESLKR